VHVSCRLRWLRMFAAVIRRLCRPDMAQKYAAARRRDRCLSNFGAKTIWWGARIMGAPDNPLARQITVEH